MATELTSGAHESKAAKGGSKQAAKNMKGSIKSQVSNDDTKNLDAKASASISNAGGAGKRGKSAKKKGSLQAGGSHEAPEENKVESRTKGGALGSSQ